MLCRVAAVNSRLIVARSLSTSPSMGQQAQQDPIKQMFVEKIREYAKKQKAQTNPDMLVDASAEQTKTFTDELDRIARVYHVQKNENMLEFPKLDFKEPTYPPLPEKQPTKK